MVQFYTSYFYQIRNFTPNTMIPVSTALWDPKWFHNNKDQKFIFKDNKGIWNGIRAEELHPVLTEDAICPCDKKNPRECNFIKEYYTQLSKLDFNQFIKDVESMVSQMRSIDPYLSENPKIILMVYEAPNNPCSERSSIHRWFHDNNYPISELKFF